jgi:hypothetical protein
MSTVETPSAPATPAKYVPPVVRSGDTVLFFNDRSDQKGGTAIVEKVTGRSLHLRHNESGISYVGIRHRDDPEIKGNPELIRHTGGVWGLTERAVSEVQLTKDIEQLKADVIELRQVIKELLKSRLPQKPGA